MAPVKRFLAQTPRRILGHFRLDRLSNRPLLGAMASCLSRMLSFGLIPNLALAADIGARRGQLSFSVGSWRGQLRQAASLVRIRPFDTSTPQGRSHERHRRVALTALARAMARGMGIVIALITVPLTVRYLGDERYGLWMTISSFIALLGFADLGMGNGLLNAISEAHGRNDEVAARRYVSSAFFMLLAVALTLGAVLLAVYPWISWPRVFNVSTPQAVAEAGPAMLVLAVCFLLNIPLGVVERVRMGYQQGFASSGWTALGLLMSLGGLLLAIRQQAGLPWLVLAMSGGPVVALLLNGALLFGWQRPWLRPSFWAIEGSAAARLFQIGLLFLVLQIAVSVAFASQNVVAAQILGAKAVTQYAVPFKLFSFPGILLAMVLTPLWPAYGEAISRGDAAWVKRTLIRSLRLSFVLGSVAAIVLVAFGRPILHLWVGPQINPPFMLLLGLGVWTVLAAVGNAISMFLNGIHVVRLQVWCALSVALASVTLSVLLTHYIGLPGVIWGTVFAYTICAIVPYFVFLPRLLEGIHPTALDDDAQSASESQNPDPAFGGVV